VLAESMTAWAQPDVPRLQQLNDWLLQTRETHEMRLQTEQMGRSLVDWLRNQAQADAARLSICAALPPTWPLAFALALHTHQAPVRDGLLASGFGWGENMVQAALKSVPLGQRSGQRILAALSAAIPEAVSHAMGLGDDDRQAFAPRLAILSARHETQYSRLFRS